MSNSSSDKIVIQGAEVGELTGTGTDRVLKLTEKVLSYSTTKSDIVAQVAAGQIVALLRTFEGKEISVTLCFPHGCNSGL